MSAVRLERQHSLPQGQPVFHTGERRHVSTAGSLEPLCGTAAQGLRSAKHCFRTSPPPCRMTMRRGLVAPGSLRPRLLRSRYFSTLFCNRAEIPLWFET